MQLPCHATFMQNCKEYEYTFRGGNSINIGFSSLLEKSTLYKGRICYNKEKILSLQDKALLRRGLVIRKPNKKSQRVVSMVKNDRKSVCAYSFLKLCTLRIYFIFIHICTKSVYQLGSDVSYSL